MRCQHQIVVYDLDDDIIFKDSVGGFRLSFQFNETDESFGTGEGAEFHPDSSVIENGTPVALSVLFLDGKGAEHYRVC